MVVKKLVSPRCLSRVQEGTFHEYTRWAGTDGRTHCFLTRRVPPWPCSPHAKLEDPLRHPGCWSQLVTFTLAVFVIISLYCLDFLIEFFSPIKVSYSPLCAQSWPNSWHIEVSEIFVEWKKTVVQKDSSVSGMRKLADLLCKGIAWVQKPFRVSQTVLSAVVQLPIGGSLVWQSDIKVDFSWKPLILRETF